MRHTHDINVISVEPLIPPRVVHEEFPETERANELVYRTRNAVQDILLGKDSRMLCVIGPCSIHDESAALDYAGRLGGLSARVNTRLLIVMRVYFEKPRTTIGWKGLINDPCLDGTFDIAKGLRKARSILLRIAELGVPAGTEMLDPISPQYTADLVSWASIGARTAESPTHRQLASGLSMPIGWKNATDGNIQTAIDAMEAARHRHSFLGIDLDGQTCIFNTKGNKFGHLILRGGRYGPNYHAEDIENACESLERAGLLPAVMVDCSHGNSRKNPSRQGRVWKDVIRQRVEGNTKIFGLMLESNLFEGTQPMGDPASLKYGVSVTDACIGWSETEDLVLYAFEALASSRG